MKTDQATNATPQAVCSTAMLGPLPECYVTSGGRDLWCEEQVLAYAAQEVAAERERFVSALADACIAAEIPDSKFESLLIALRA